MGISQLGNRPNIILIVADDLGYGDLGCYGSKVNATPAIDNLAAEGTMLTDFYMAAPVCSPSRAALMTGCYPKRVGLEAGSRATVLRPADNLGLAPEEITIADLLKEAGYATGLVGKWHLGDQEPFLPHKHGFDYYFGLPYSNDMGPDHWQEKFPPLPLMHGNKLVESGPHQSTLTHRYTDACINFIQKNRETPFFLYFAHMYVHLPLFVPPEFAAASKNGEYGAAVECIDWSMQQIITTLEKLGIQDNTLIIFTSDNGSNTRDGGSNAPLRGRKGTTWEGGQRVPFIASWPGTIPPNGQGNQLTSAMDLLPTCAELGGITIPDDRIIDGKSMTDILTSPVKAPGIHEMFYYYKGPDLEAVRKGKWKLHLKSLELYNMDEDIGETVNLYDAYSTISSELTTLAEAAREDLGDGELAGKNCRSPGFVQNPVFIHERNNPASIAEYDLSD